MQSYLLRIQKLRVEFPTEDGLVVAVDGLDMEIGRGRTVGLVGESGCGKSVTGFAILRLLQPPGRIVGGAITYYPNGNGAPIDLTQLHPHSESMRSIRGREIAMIFQEPMSSLTPVYTIGQQIVEAIRVHERVSAAAARKRAIELLARVGIPAPEQRVDAYPHHLSGGMRQRAMIAMALSCSPRLLIADEPTTALDVTVQAQILDLLQELQAQSELSVLMVTHNMGVVAAVADDVVVMYAGVGVESAPVYDLFADPLHPYTQALLRSAPTLRRRRGERLFAVEGVVPDWWNRPAGCLFEPRCPISFDRCVAERPSMVEVSDDHKVACWAVAGREAGSRDE